MSRGETQLHCSDSMPSGLTKMVITVGGQSTPRSCPCCPPRSGCPPSISSARVPPSPQDDGRHTPWRRAPLHSFSIGSSSPAPP